MKIKLLSHDVNYKVEDPGLWRHSGMGMASVVDMAVVINKNMPKDAIRSTTLHEIVHIVDGLLQLELTEQQVDGVAIGIHSLLKDNKRFMENLYD